MVQVSAEPDAAAEPQTVGDFMESSRRIDKLLAIARREIIVPEGDVESRGAI